jgi:hypothetical protein
MIFDYRQSRASDDQIRLYQPGALGRGGRAGLGDEPAQSGTDNHTDENEEDFHATVRVKPASGCESSQHPADTDNVVSAVFVSLP